MHIGENTQENYFTFLLYMGAKLSLAPREETA
jgi:hypothetical protein